MKDLLLVRRVLLSVADKNGLVELARLLVEQGAHLLSTGGSASRLREEGLEVEEVSSYTGFPELMEGRLKTLHPLVHGAILGRGDQDEEEMHRHGILALDMVVVNLYPFVQRAATGLEEQKLVEYIDIGGPAMLRAAAKNHARVAVLSDPADYPGVLEELRTRKGSLCAATRRALAVRAFARTAAYDAAITAHFGAAASPPALAALAALAEVAAPPGEEASAAPWPEKWQPALLRKEALRYGENPHQRAALYLCPEEKNAGVAGASLLQGKALSYNNIADADVAWECVRAFPAPTCVVVKHATPCGVASGANLEAACRRAYEADPVSAYGGVVACNRALDEGTAAFLAQHFVEVLALPEILPPAAQLLLRRKNLRILVCGEASGLAPGQYDYHGVGGGVLIQERDRSHGVGEPAVVTRRSPTEQEWRDLRFAWEVVKFVRSNAVVCAAEECTLGIGGGQTSRVDSVRIALEKIRRLESPPAGVVLASDAFFPFADGVELAAQAGVRAVIQPGGSRRDEEVIAAADQGDMAMVCTAMRHFRH